MKTVLLTLTLGLLILLGALTYFFLNKQERSTTSIKYLNEGDRCDLNTDEICGKGLVCSKNVKFPCNAKECYQGPGKICKPQSSVGFKIGDFSECNIVSRSNLNHPTSEKSLTDKSQVTCTVDNSEMTLFNIVDKQGFEGAKNSVEQVWMDEQGLKAMVIDQNGAGSGEGYGKTILLKAKTFELLSCFYYTYETFHENYNEFPAFKALTPQQIASIGKSPILLSDPHCNNFSVQNYID